MKELFFYLAAVLCLAVPGFSSMAPPPQSEDEFLRSLCAPALAVTSVIAPESRLHALVPGLEEGEPSIIAASCSEEMPCSGDLQCAPGACAGGYCFCGCIPNWPCGGNTNNCGLDGYCLRGACFCL